MGIDLRSIPRPSHEKKWGWAERRDPASGRHTVSGNGQGRVHSFFALFCSILGQKGVHQSGAKVGDFGQKGQKRVVKKGSKNGQKRVQNTIPMTHFWVIGMVFHCHVLARVCLVASEKRDLKMYKIRNTTSIPMIHFWIIGIDVNLKRRKPASPKWASRFQKGLENVDPDDPFLDHRDH